LAVDKRAYRDLTPHQEGELLRTALSNTPNAASARREIIRFFEQPIESIAREFSSSPALLEDLKQEGRVALHIAIPRFNLAQGTRLLTYAGKGMRRRMLRFIQKEYKHRHYDSLDDYQGEDKKDFTALVAAPPFSNYGEDWIISQIAEHELALLLGRAMEPLTERQRGIIYFRFSENRTLADIAFTFGISCTSVFRELNSGLAKIKRMMPSAYYYR
jgi:RNA polymerase sigma factor (sigma-70 family)